MLWLNKSVVFYLKSEGKIKGWCCSGKLERVIHNTLKRMCMLKEGKSFYCEIWAITIGKCYKTFDF